MDFLQITNDPDLARRCDALPGMRLFVDLERNGKAARQAGRNTFISTHQPEDVGRIKAQLRRSQLMVRVNPLHEGTAVELDTVLAHIRLLARKIAFLVINTRIANKVLPDGRNAHLIIEPGTWWDGRLEAAGFTRLPEPSVWPPKKARDGKYCVAVLQP